MSVHSKDNKFLSYLIILVSLFVLVFVTKDQFSDMQINLDTKQNYEMQRDAKKSKLQDLNVLREQLKQDTSTWSQDIKRFSTFFKEDELINYIYSYVEESNSEDSIVVINDVSLAEAKKNELGFEEIDLNIGLRVSSELAMINFLNFLLSENSKYSFFINNFSYPNDDREWSFNVSIPLKVFYK